MMIPQPTVVDLKNGDMLWLLTPRVGCTLAVGLGSRWCQVVAAWISGLEGVQTLASTMWQYSHMNYGNSKLFRVCEVRRSHLQEQWGPMGFSSLSFPHKGKSVLAPSLGR